MPFIMAPIGAPVLLGRANAFVVLGTIGCWGCGEKDDRPLPGGGFRLNPDDPVPVGVEVAGGGGREKEEEDARLLVMLGRCPRDMDDIPVFKALLVAFVAGGDAQGLEVDAVPQFKDDPVEDCWLNDGAALLW
jgi:hypothetical protein